METKSQVDITQLADKPIRLDSISKGHAVHWLDGLRCDSDLLYPDMG